MKKGTKGKSKSKAIVLVQTKTPMRYYKLLGVKPTATADQIIKAYRNLVRKCIYRDFRKTEQKLKGLNSAYIALTNTKSPQAPIF